MHNKFLRVILYMILATTLIGAAILAWQILIPLRSEPLALKVQKGETAAHIAVRLEERGIIRSSTIFRLLAALRGSDRHLIAGTYSLGGKNSLLQALKLLEQGNTSAVRVTFPEGLSLKATLQKLERSGLAPYAVLDSLARSPELVFELTGIRTASLEGFLYPETYAFDIGSTPLELLQMMTTQFKNKLREAGIDYLRSSGFYERLILASIVERESGSPEERKLVAGVLANRLNKGMRLESCATVDYLLEQQGQRKPVLSFEDTRLPSPYNTYIKEGLPPGPICNPSLNSIQAALQPARTDYLFFVADRQGNNSFSVTASEHFQKIRQYRGSDWR